MRQVIFSVTLLWCCLLVQPFASAQSVSGKLAAAFRAFQQDPQLRNGLASLCVLDAATGDVVFGENELIGLAPASTLKVITSASAYELLGSGFRYKTAFAYLRNGNEASLLITPSGDPTLGSWRWGSTKEEAVVGEIAEAMQGTGIKAYTTVLLDNGGWNTETIPDGWMWQDIGNYYGAGPAKLNWRENQFDVFLKSGSKIGEPVSVVGTMPGLYGYKLQSELTAAASGTGDQAYIYFPLNGSTATIRGTIPVSQSRFTISGAMPDAAHQFVGTVREAAAKAGIKVPGKALVREGPPPGKYTTFHTVTSPPLDSIIYWFNRKSINLYGEALIKTIAYKSTGTASTSSGVDLVRKFWKANGIPESELNLVDGSGLSPLNRVTAHAQARVLLYASRQPWFSGFYASLPVFNGMKMKSGTLHGVKGFCGYHKGKDGKTYVFSFLVNNYNGSQASLVKKMYTVLDVLK